MAQQSSRSRGFRSARISRLLPLGLLLACSGCGLPRTATPPLTPPMPVQAPLRKQVLQGYMPFGSIGWVNNEQIAFHGSPVGLTANKKSLYVWMPPGKPRKLLERSHSSCTRSGEIKAIQLNRREDGGAKSFSLRGPDFSQKEQHGSHIVQPGTLDQVSCTWITTPVPLKDHRWIPLRRGQGFLDFGPRDDPSAVRAVHHLPPDLQTRQDTGIRLETPMLPMAVHAAHDDSYLVFDLNLTLAEAKDWIQSDKRTIWRLDRQRRGRAVTLPAGPWVGLGGGTISFLPSRPGVLITSKNFNRDRSAGGAGLYLLRPGGQPQRLERGLVQEPAVSPDGCRVAYGFRPRLDTGLPEGGPRLVVLDLCDAITPAKS